jgi:hypothetical protein
MSFAFEFQILIKFDSPRSPAQNRGIFALLRQAAENALAMHFQGNSYYMTLILNEKK